MDIIDASSVIQFQIPTSSDLERLSLVNNNNYTELLSSTLLSPTSTARYSSRSSHNNNVNLELDYTMVAAAIWIIIIATFILVTIIFCVCSCMFYRKIYQWKMENRLTNQLNDEYNNNKVAHQQSFDDTLPSYTLVSGLPSYEAAIKNYTENCNYNLHTTINQFESTDEDINETNHLTITNQQEQQQQPSIFNIFRKLRQNSNTSTSSSSTISPISTDIPNNQQQIEACLLLPKNDEIKSIIIEIPSTQPPTSATTTTTTTTINCSIPITPIIIIDHPPMYTEELAEHKKVLLKESTSINIDDDNEKLNIKNIIFDKI